MTDAKRSSLQWVVITYTIILTRTSTKLMRGYERNFRVSVAETTAGIAITALCEIVATLCDKLWGKQKNFLQSGSQRQNDNNTIFLPRCLWSYLWYLGKMHVNVVVRTEGLFMIYLIKNKASCMFVHFQLFINIDAPPYVYPVTIPSIRSIWPLFGRVAGYRLISLPCYRIIIVIYGR